MKASDFVFGLRFQFRPVLTIFTALALTILVTLGNWQLDRLDWKRDLIAQTEMISREAPRQFSDVVAGAAKRDDAKDGDIEYSVVEISGYYIDGSDQFVFGAIEGAPGVFHFAPMRSGEMVVFVNRGFIPQSAYKSGSFSKPLADEQTRIVGLLRKSEILRPPASWVVSRKKSADGLWSTRDPALFGAKAGIANISPFYIDAFETPGAVEWPKGGTTRINFSNRHLEYAWTWFGLAGALLAVWAAMSFSRK